MTYDNELILIDIRIEPDEIGQQLEVHDYTPILCKIKSIGRNEFYAAAQNKLKPEITFIIHEYEYSGQRKVIFKGFEYKVIRTYSAGYEEVGLVCERGASNG